MKRFQIPRRIYLVAFACMLMILSALSSRAAGTEQSHEKSVPEAAVTVADNGNFWTLDNGIVKAVIGKSDGRMTSLAYRGIETMRSGGGYWEQTPQDAPQLTDRVTINPATNGGARAEIAVKGVTGDIQMLTPKAPGGGTYCDMEIRYALGRGESGIYVYAIFTHPASYRAGGVGGESRYITRLNQTFDWITVDKDRNMLECAPSDWGTGVVVHAKEQRILTKGVYKNSVEHKYSYSGVQYRTPAYGWSSTRDHIGIWFINPTIEYLSGGPTKNELDAHFGDNADPDPIILDYWEGGHYDTGARTNLAAGEEWTKVIGPIFVYVNALEKPKATTQTELDTLAATSGSGEPTAPASWRENANALWQDALTQAGKETAKWPYSWVSSMVWKPVRYGKQLWDIGYPDRTGGKFFKGDGANYWLWGWNLRYALLFPNDLTYTIGKSDYRRDWFFEEVPHATNLSFVNPAAKDPANQRFGWVRGESLEQYPQTDTRGPWAVYGQGRATVWTIKFSMAEPARGEAFLRAALAGVNAIKQLAVTVNGQSAGAIGDGSDAENAALINTNSIRYNSDKGLSEERTLKFNAALLRQGENEMTLSVPGGDLQSGVVWDYLRLELNDHSAKETELKTGP